MTAPSHRSKKSSTGVPIQQLRIAIDTGGTFTDCVWLEAGRLRTLKVFSTPGDPSRAIVEALEKIGSSAGLTLLHGTTVGTNALLERKGARVALITTSGFEDAIQIGRQNRPRLYDLFFEKPDPLVPAELRFGVEERTGPDGNILEALDVASLEGLLSRVRAAAPQAAAISLLFSFANQENERRAAATLEPLGIPLSVSHRILPEFREYERTSTVVVNAYLQPLMGRYLRNVATQVEKAVHRKTRSQTKCRFFVMQSNGGIAALATASEEPVRTVLSGPAGGVVGAAEMARRSGFERVITFDMGGTSTDVALIDRVAVPGSQAQIAGFPVGVPMLDIHTVGAGGGSLARFDAGGALRVGPESAGADPGPICYGRGVQPTVTDANLLLGRLPADRFLGGEFRLDLDRTHALVTGWLHAQGSKLRVEEFCAGVIRVVNANMEKAIRVVSIERGYDPREFSLLAFGGAGAMHACELAASLGIPRVIVPALPGALSAYGILVSDVVKDFSRTVLWQVRSEVPRARLEQELASLEESARLAFANEGWTGKIEHRRSVDLRYRGQGYELSVPYSANLLQGFHDQHQRRYGYCHPDREVELVTVRLRATVRSPRLRESVVAEKKMSAKTASKTAFWFDSKKVQADVWLRDQLTVGKRYRGPAIVAEYSATTVVAPRMIFQVDRAGNILIDCRRSIR